MGSAREKRCRSSNERGFIILVVMLFIVGISLLALAANRNSIIGLGIASNHTGSVQSFYGAEGAADYACNQLSRVLMAGNNIIESTTFNPAPVAGWTSTAAPRGEVSPQQIPAGSHYAGLQAIIQNYAITGTAVDTSGATSTVNFTVQRQSIPLFQAMAFDTRDMFIANASEMDINGWVHTNGSLYLGPIATLRLNSNVTASRHIYHSFPSFVPGGSAAAYLDNKRIGDTGHPDNSTQASWASYFQNTDVKVLVPQIHLPLPADHQSDAYILGRVGEGAVGSKSAVLIVGNTAYLSDGHGNTTTRLETCRNDPNQKNSNGTLKYDDGCVTEGLNHNSITTNGIINTVGQGDSFTDYREGRTAKTTTVDLQQFQQTAAWTQLQSDSQPTGANKGVLGVYPTTVDTSNSFGAVRLVNGATLGAPLTVVTDRPAYIQGNYNTTNQPAAIMADAVTALSSNWSTKSDNTSRSQRGAQETTVNTCIIAGDVRHSGSTEIFNGGLNNLIRFLEDWGGTIPFTFSGSMVSFFESAHVHARWQGGYPDGVYYNQPVRTWGYNFNINALPPGTPMVTVIQRSGWQAN